jgi:hypothetical protein
VSKFWMGSEVCMGGGGTVFTARHNRVRLMWLKLEVW